MSDRNKVLKRKLESTESQVKRSTGGRPPLQRITPVKCPVASDEPGPGVSQSKRHKVEGYSYVDIVSSFVVALTVVVIALSYVSFFLYTT